MAGDRGRATLIVNPASGRASLLARQMPAIVDLLAQRGYRVSVLHTTPQAGNAAALAREAAADSALILACGGDGTVHDVVQGLVGGAPVPLGVLPLGTANVLARNLALPLEPLAAAARLLTFQAKTIALGRAETDQAQRWFTVMAGCGPDGALASDMPPSLKKRFGRAAYYAYAARLFVSRPWPVFTVRYRKAGWATWCEKEVVAALVARVPDLGGAFSGLTHEVPLMGPSLDLYLLRAPAQIALPAWFAASRLRTANPWLERVQADEVVCEGSPAVLCQADAEPLGGLPMRLTMIPDSLNLLMPG